MVTGNATLGVLMVMAVTDMVAAAILNLLAVAN